MQVLELQDQLQRLGERLPPPSPDSYDRVVVRARKRLRRRRVLTPAAIAAVCAAIAVPVGYATSTTAPEIVRVGPTANLRHPGKPARVPAVVVNTIREYREPVGTIVRLHSVTMKVMPWRDLARYVPGSKKWAPAAAKVYVILQKGSNKGAGVPQGVEPVYWQIIVLNLDNSAQMQIPGLPGHGLPATREPSYWRGLPGPEYVLNLKTGSVGQRSNGK